MIDLISALVNGALYGVLPLTNAEIRSIIDHMGIPVKTGNTATKFARAIEAAHGIV